MRSGVSLYAQVLAFLLILLYIIKKALDGFTAFTVPVGLLVVLLLALSIWDVVKFHRKKNDKGHL